MYLPLYAAAASRWTRRLTSIRVEYADGSGMTLGPSEGDLSIGTKNSVNAEVVPVYNRDSHDGFVIGRDLVQELTITLQVKNETLTSAVAARWRDFMAHTGFFASATSFDDTLDACFKLIATYTDGTVTTTETYPKCEGAWTGPNDGVPSTCTLTIRNHTAPTVA